MQPIVIKINGIEYTSVGKYDLERKVFGFVEVFVGLQPVFFNEHFDLEHL